MKKAILKIIMVPRMKGKRLFNIPSPEPITILSMGDIIAAASILLLSVVSIATSPLIKSRVYERR